VYRLKEEEFRPGSTGNEKEKTIETPRAVDSCGKGREKAILGTDGTCLEDPALAVGWNHPTSTSGEAGKCLNRDALMKRRD